MTTSKSDAPKVERGSAPMRVIRSAYDGLRRRVALFCDPKRDRTQQSFKDECDINVLMKRFEKTGILPAGRDLPPQFGDVTSFDFVESMNQVAAVRGVFSQLDARTRARFENDPAQMLDFLADPANGPEAVKLGLRPKAPQETPQSIVAAPAEPVKGVVVPPVDKSPEAAEAKV